MKNLIVVLLILTSTIFSQFVDELVLNETVNTDGIHVEPDGTIYSTEAWNGTDIFKITQDGTVEIFATGLKGPIDILRGLDGNFYVSEWTGSSLAKVSPQGVVSEFASVKPGPGPMTMDKNGNIFVTHNINNGSSFVSIVDTAGNASVYISGSPIKNPGGIDIDAAGNLYIANFNDGKIIKVDTAKNKTVLATVPGTGTWKTGHLKYIDGFIYISAIEDHRIYKMDLEGNLAVYTGTGEPGRTNGDLNQAQFNNPNGLGKTDDGSMLYVTASFGPTNYIQRIVFFDPSSVDNKERLKVGYELQQNYPNPFNPETKIQYFIQTASDVNLRVFDSIGNEVETLVNNFSNIGTFEVSFDGSNYSSGIYFYQLRANDFVQTKKMMLIK